MLQECVAFPHHGAYPFLLFSSIIHIHVTSTYHLHMPNQVSLKELLSQQQQQQRARDYTWKEERVNNEGEAI